MIIAEHLFMHCSVVSNDQSLGVDVFEWGILSLFNSDVSCTDPMPIYAQLTKGRNLFVGQSSSHAHDESSMDGPPTRRTGESKVAFYYYISLKFVLLDLVHGDNK